MIKKRRENLYKNFVNNSCFILFSKDKNHRRDSDFDLHNDKNIFYFTNLELDFCGLLITKNNSKIKEYLILKKQSQNEINFCGEVDEKKLSKNSKIQNIIYFDDLEKFFQNKKFEKIYFYEDSRSNENYKTYYNFIKKLKKKFSKKVFENSYDFISNLRNIKDKSEISKIKKATNLIEEFFKKFENKIRKNEFKNEKDIESLFYQVCFKNNCVPFYYPIIASGKNSLVLHYTKNNSKINFPILLDLGFEYKNYGCDISRTFIDEKSIFQKKVYNSVLNIQKKILGILKEGISFNEIEIKTLEFLKEELLKLKLINKKFEKENVVEGKKVNKNLVKALREFMPHSFGHSLGLDTHDLETQSNVLKNGMIITVEPGIYIKNKFGIRIEDNVLIKKNGIENLSKEIKK